MQLACRILATSLMKSGNSLNPCCLRAYLPESRLVLLTGRNGRSLMASSINSRMAVTGVIYPETCPLTRAVYWHYKRWRTAGVCEQLMNVFTWTSASTGQKKAKWTTLIIIDSQAVKNTCNADVESKGYCFYKATNGIKRHLAIDTLGFPFFTHCTPANVTDDVGLIEMLTQNINYFKAKPVNIPKITILLDHGYHLDYLTQQLEQIYPQMMTKIKFERSTKPSRARKGRSRKILFCSGAR